MTAVVLVTGHGSVSAAVKAMKLGAIDYVAKPVDASKLRNLVAGILEGRSPGPLPNRLLEPAAGACRRCTGSGVWVATNTPLEEVEREVVLSTLRANRGNKNRTAKILGISRRSLYDRLARWGSLTAPRQASTSAE